MNAAAGGSSRAAGRDGLWKRIIVSLLVLAALLVLFGAPLLRYGAVVGQEFAPGRFQRRTYHYWEIPLIHVQMTPLKKQDDTNDLEKYLVAQKLVVPRNEAKPRWDLVSLARGGVEAPPGDAAILCRYLDIKNDEGDLIWLKWSKDNAALAKVFWPAVADAARREMYIVAPELFHLALAADDAAELKNELAQRLAERYENTARVQQQLGQHQRAVELFDASLQHNPELAAAKEGRAESLRAKEAAAAGPAKAAS
jgi:hypothetical protein